MLPFVLVAKVAIGATMALGAHHASAATTHVVQPNETLWSISAPEGHNWEHLYLINRDKISDPNLIYAGEDLRTSGQVQQAQTSAVVTPAAAPVHTDQFDGNTQYGCGDGDGDGSHDTPCSVAFPHTLASVPVRVHSTAPASVSSGTSSAYHASGSYSYSGLEALWESAGGPSWAAPKAAEIAECESGGNTSAYNPSGATGVWQILGSVVPGNLYDAYTNALNAVSKFKASGDTFAQWVCQ